MLFWPATATVTIHFIGSTSKGNDNIACSDSIYKYEIILFPYEYNHHQQQEQFFSNTVASFTN